MPRKLSERPEELVRQFLVDSIRPSEVEGYDPMQTDPSASDFLPVTNNWSTEGSYYPMVSVREMDGPTLPDSAGTNYNSQQGDGSGPNQYTVYNLTLSCQAIEGGSYRNDVDADDLALALYQECAHQIQVNPTSAVDEAAFISATPSTQSRSIDEDDSGSTTVWVQRQGSVAFGFLKTP